ncbi:MAG: 1-deoxy-D-xylulose-5-phosphate synthase [Butyrivibrio sp.]
MLLDNINNPNDIKNISPEDYAELAREIRECIIKNVSKNGGHLSSPLGVVELTMALHLSFSLPKDKILWDVGHQAYAHKILTGRKDEFVTLRQHGGLSGFPTLAESECDCFGMGHASTSLSAALGFVKARELSGEDNYVVSVIGDGALTGGMAFEALNNASSVKGNMIIILNDNEMSISRNVGGVSKLLTNLRTDEKYNDLKYRVKSRLSRIPDYGDELIGKIHKTKSSIKQIFVPGMMFEDMGITYLGPVDGHDINKLMKIISMAKKLDHAVLIHVHTQKGKGYYFSEKRPSMYHGIGPFNPATGEPTDKTKVRTYSDVFSTHIVRNAKEDSKIVAITAAMSEGCGLKRFEKTFPDRFFDVGIAEEHAVTFAAGLATEGYKPYVAIYSSFLQRAFDQILHDVCIQKLPVRFIVERAGIVGADGITHQGVFDLSYLNIIPNMTVMAPKNRFEFKSMIDYSVNFDGPLAIRIPKGKASEVYSDNMAPIEYGKSEILIKGSKVAVIAVGSCVETANELEDILVDNGFDPTIVNARFVKPVDEELIKKLAVDHELIVTIEENVLNGGYGMNVLHYVNNNNIDVKVLTEALPDCFIEHGESGELKQIYGLSALKISEDILRRFNR